MREPSRVDPIAAAWCTRDARPARNLKFRVTNAVNKLQAVRCQTAAIRFHLLRTDTMQIDFSSATRSPLTTTGPSADTTGASSTAATAPAATAGGANGSPGAASTGEALGASSAAPEDPAVKQLKALIERLQKQLAAVQQQIAAVAQRAKQDPAAAVEQQSLSAEAGTLSAALSTAIAQLAQAIQKSGGSSSGGLVSTQA
jgi:hypothetical protein